MFLICYYILNKQSNMHTHILFTQICMLNDGIFNLLNIVITFSLKNDLQDPLKL